MITPEQKVLKQYLSWRDARLENIGRWTARAIDIGVVLTINGYTVRKAGRAYTIVSLTETVTTYAVRPIVDALFTRVSPDEVRTMLRAALWEKEPR